MSDEHDEKAEGLLPCDVCVFMSFPGHDSSCPAFYRPAVAADRRELAAEIERLKSEIQNERQEVIEAKTKWFLPDAFVQFRRDLRQLLYDFGVPSNPGFTENCIVAALRALMAEKDNEIVALKDAINETLRLAKDLNVAAERGAGYEDHWGERVMQTVGPLRDVKATASEILRHNRSLLEYKGQLVEKVHEKDAEIATLTVDLDRLTRGSWSIEIARQSGINLDLRTKLEAAEKRAERLAEINWLLWKSLTAEKRHELNLAEIEKPKES